jgi:hypothetical protein
VDLLCVPYIITSQTKKSSMVWMRSYGNTVNILLGLRAMVVLQAKQGLGCERKSNSWKNRSKRCERLAVFRDWTLGGELPGLHDGGEPGMELFVIQ